jgi:MEDS: MEthanogen/methylotroph, DcmR Sensory domain
MLLRSFAASVSKDRAIFRRSSLFPFRRGSHTCLFYESDDVLLEILTPYIAEGLLGGERCFCAQKPAILKRLAHNLTFLGIDAKKEADRGKLELHTQDEVYFPEKQFEPRILMDTLIRFIHQTRKEGYTAFRSAGDLSWAVDGCNETGKVLDYEKMVDEYYPGQPAIGLCQYPIRQFAPDALESISQHHKMKMTETGPNSVHFSIHLRYGNCNAEVVADNFAFDPRYDYVVQRHRTQEIMGWGVASTFDGALKKTDRLAAKSS